MHERPYNDSNHSTASLKALTRTGIHEYNENILENPSNLQTYTITQNLGNGFHMCTTTPAIDTRPIFLMHLSVHPFVSFDTLSEKTRLGAK